MKWTIDSILNVLMPMVKHSLDSSQELVNRTALPRKVKEALHVEIYYYFAEQLRDFVWNIWRFYDHHSRAMVFRQFDDPFYHLFGFPSQKTLLISPSALNHVLHFQGELLSRANIYWHEDPDKAHAEGVFRSTLHISHEDLLKQDSLYGDAYCYMITARSTLPAYAYEEILAAEIQFYYSQKDMKDMGIYLKELANRFPGSTHLPQFEQQFNNLHKLEKRYANAPGIRFRQDGSTIRSIRDLVAPYKGKVVFLDFWGTWCAWCLEEFRTAVPALTKKFEGKDVVFLYVADDDDTDDQKWKNDIFIYDIEGEHVRITRNNMHFLRDELDKSDKVKRAGTYPTYYIFDRQGQQVVNNACRPSTGAALYHQLDSVLKLAQ